MTGVSPTSKRPSPPSASISGYTSPRFSSGGHSSGDSSPWNKSKAVSTADTESRWWRSPIRRTYLVTRETPTMPPKMAIAGSTSPRFFRTTKITVTAAISPLATHHASVISSYAPNDHIRRVVTTRTAPENRTAKAARRTGCRQPTKIPIPTPDTAMRAKTRSS